MSFVLLVFVLFLMYQMLSVSLDRSFFSVPSVFSNVYCLIVGYGTINVQHYHFSHIKTRKNSIKHYTIKLPCRLFSCIKKIETHGVTEILLKVALITIILTLALLHYIPLHTNYSHRFLLSTG